MTTIQTDVDTNDYGLDEAADAFLKQAMGEETPPDGKKKEDTSEAKAPESPAEDAEEDLLFEDDSAEADPSKDDNDDTETPKHRTAEDDDEVEIKVDDEVKKVSVKELKRLFGQEASLTRKSQETAALRKTAETQNQRAALALTTMYERAKERSKVFEKVDLFEANRELQPDEFAQLRKDMKSAEDDLKFFETEINDLHKTLVDEQRKALQEQAKAAVQVLQEKIPNWSPAYYDELRAFAINEGLVPEVVNNLVDPAAIIMFHKAAQYDKAKARAKDAKAKAQKKTSETKPKVLKPGNSQGAAPAKSKEAIAAMRKNGGDIESAMNAMLAKWQDDA